MEQKKFFAFSIFLLPTIVVSLSIISLFVSSGFCMPPDMYEDRVAYCERCNNSWNEYLFHPSHGQQCPSETQINDDKDVFDIDCKTLPHGAEGYCSGTGYYGCPMNPYGGFGIIGFIISLFIIAVVYALLREL